MSLNKSQALNAANEYVLQHNVPAAVKTYQEIIEADPTDLTAINMLGDLYAGAGRIQEAIALFSSLAASYIDGGFMRKAIETLTKMIALDPANSETAIRLADLYAQAGLPSEARQHYLQIAETLTRNRRMLDALIVYGKVVELDPLNTSTRIKLGELYLREGMDEQAYDAFVTAAKQLAAEGENRRALNAYNEALAIKPDTEVLAAVRELMASLGVADQGKSSRTTQSATSRTHASRSSSGSLGAARARESAPLDHDPQPSDSFVVQEISKAEILVAYGQVHQAISMLRDVLRDKADNIDVHVKLKDIYLRTGMMAEAGQECVELERIHEARGESERARDYAVRASRLTQLIEQPSGDLPEPARKPVPAVEPRANAAPLKVAESPDIALKTSPVAIRRDARPVQTMTASSISSGPPALEVATITESSLQPASLLSPGETLEPISEAKLDRRLSLERVVANVTNQSANASQRPLPALFAGSLPVERKRGRLTAAAIGAGVLVLLVASAVIGGFAYDSHLNEQYQALALAAPALAVPAPPAALEPAESQPGQEIEPITVVVTPTIQPDPAAQRTNPEPRAIEAEQPAAAPQPAIEIPKVKTQPPPMPPRAAVGPDNRALTENRTPLGVPLDVPVGPTHPAEPPPKAVRQSPGVVLGGAVKKVDPVYPSSARTARLMGVVAVEVTISEQGNVISARALSGPGLLRDAALTAARAWKFRASTLGGVPVTTTTTIVFNFKL